MFRLLCIVLVLLLGMFEFDSVVKAACSDFSGGEYVGACHTTWSMDVGTVCHTDSNVWAGGTCGMMGSVCAACHFSGMQCSGNACVTGNAGGGCGGNSVPVVCNTSGPTPTSGGSPTGPPPPNMHTGRHDGSTCTHSGGWACCTGWSCDQTEIAHIKLYDGPPNGNHLIGEGDANSTRPDPGFVEASGCNSADHGFEIDHSVPLTSGTHDIYAVYVQNDNTELLSTPQTVVCADVTATPTLTPTNAPTPTPTPIPPTCSISGPTTVVQDDSAQYCVSADNAPNGAEIWKSPTGNQDWETPPIRAKSDPGCSSTSFSQAGTYYVVGNAFGNGATCTGNPFPNGIPSGWSDCGPNCTMTVNVVTPTAVPTPVLCYVTTSPSSVCIGVDGSATVSASVTSGLGSATVSTMVFGSYDTAIATINPTFDYNSPYSTTVTGVANGNSAVWATAILSDDRVCWSSGDTDANVTVGSCGIPTPTLTPLSPTAWCDEAPNPVAYGGDATITLHSTNATSCAVWNNGNQLYSGSNTSGDYVDGPLTTPGNNQGKVECWNSGVSSGQNTCNYTVSNPIPTVTLAPTPTPTLGPCQVTTVPSVLNMTVGDIATVTASVTSGLGSATVTRMDFGSYSPAIASVNPTFDVVSPYSTTVTAVAPGNTAVWATATLSDTRTCQTTGLTDTNVNVVKANSVPTVGTLVIKNSAGTPVAAETGSRNQICQTDFGGFKNVTFELTVNDLDGCTDLSTAQLRWNNHIYDLTLNNCVGSVTVDYPGVNDPDLHEIDGKVTDLSLATSGWVNTTRNWKVWDCNVSTSGNIYEITNGTLCVGDTTEATNGLNYTKTIFTGMGGATTKEIVKLTNHSYSSPPSLVWSKQYVASLNADLNGDQPRAMKVNGVCQGDVQLTLNQATIDAYQASPALTIDLGSVMNQDPWWQALGGGVMVSNNISDRTPVTCVAPCISAIINENLNIGVSSDGVALGEIIGNTSSWYSYPRNNYRIGMNGKGENTSYSALYNKLFSESGVGVTYSGSANWGQIMTDTGGTGVVFVNGDLLIDSDNTIDSGKFLMVVVKGKINIDVGVNNVEGVLVSDGDVVINGKTRDTPLGIDGIVYTNGQVIIGRGYLTVNKNNTDAAVKFNYRPDLLFNMPAAVSRELSKWRVGQ